MRRVIARPAINIVSIGVAGVGKTTLASAITRVLALKGQANFQPVEEIREAAPDEMVCFGPRFAYVRYKTEHYDCWHFDATSDQQIFRWLIEWKLDGVILVVDSDQVLSETTERQLELCQQLNVPLLAVFVNDKADQG